MKIKKAKRIFLNSIRYVYRYEIKGKSIKKLKKSTLDQVYLKKYGIINTLLLRINLKRGNSLINKKKYAKVEILLNKAKVKWPDNIQLYKMHAKMAKDMNNMELSCSLWKETTIQFPDNEQMLFKYIMSLITVNKIELAYELCKKEKAKLSNILFVKAMANIYMAWYDWDAALSVLISLPGYDKSNIYIRILEADTRFRKNGIKGLEAATEILETLYLKFPESIYIKIKLAEHYIFAFRQADASKLIKALYYKDKHNFEVLILYAWFKHSIGDEKKAKIIWNTLIKKHPIKRPSLYLYKENPDRLDNNPLPVEPGKILLFTCIKNEINRLPWFFKYYRKLGVDQFFFVDNGSNDGSTDFLRKQKDVHLFWTEYNYGKSGSGMQWINKLIDIYGKKHWCIYLDVDEALIFPGIEQRSLKYLINYMNKKGHEAFRTFMLDMYPHNTNDIFRKSVDDPIAQCPYFDNNYQFFGAYNCPYTEVKGGIRNNLFGERVALTKTPIISGNKEIKFISSSHCITPAKVSDVTGVLLHYKLASDLGKRSLEEFSQKNRVHFCNQRHLNYKNILDKLGDNHTLVNPLTLRYESSDQLVKLGLMTKPDDFD